MEDSAVKKLTEDSGIRGRALELLVYNSPEVTANALGVSPGRISQLLAEEDFALAVGVARFKNLQKYNETDEKYDSMEAEVLGKLKECIPLMFQPGILLKTLQVLNSAKRRGAVNPEGISGNATVVPITIPAIIRQTFVQNINAQVVQVGDRELVTIQPANLLKRVGAGSKEQIRAPQEVIQARVKNLLENSSNNTSVNKSIHTLNTLKQKLQKSENSGETYDQESGVGQRLKAGVG